MKVEVEKYLPHAEPMVMIADGEDIADGEAAAFAVTSADSVFFDAAVDGVPGCAALEYMAQTMALAVGLKARRNGEEPKIGFILGSRRLETSIPVFRRDGRYRVHAKCDYADDQFGSFICGITDESGATVASGTLTAFQSNANQQQQKE